MSTSTVYPTCPKFFEDLCEDKSHPDPDRFVEAGRQLALRIGELTPPDADSDDWTRDLTRLQNLIRDRDHQGTLIWFEQHLPGCMGVVPINRYDAVRRGFIAALTEGGVELAGH